MTVLEMPDGESCAFCDYLRGTRPYTVLWREPLVAVLVTREQRGVAHLLVLPMVHRPTLLDLRDHEAYPMMVAIRDAGRAITNAYGRPGLSLWQNNGLPAHQAIPHLHFHVAGTLPGGGTDFGEVPELTLAATDEIARRVAPHVPTADGRRVLT